MITHEEVGRRIRQAREQLRMSQGEFGRLLSPPRTHAAVSDMERGKTKLDVEELSTLARLLDKPLEYFIEERPAPSVLYRRGDRKLTPDGQRDADRAVEAFKQLARERARQAKAQESDT
jgi:transcriptional regulator with XRE-family HTH domain